MVNARRARACVTEASFYSLAQHFAVALFECHEADDFAPAKSLMNMCFTFYHEGKKDLFKADLAKYEKLLILNVEKN